MKMRTLAFGLTAVFWMIVLGITLGQGAGILKLFFPMMRIAPTITPTPSPKSTPYPPPTDVTQTPTVTPVGSVTMLDSTTISATQSKINVLGEFFNGTNVNISYPQLRMELRNSSDQVVGLAYSSSYDSPSVLRPGDKTSFSLSYNPPLPWVNYSTRITWDRGGEIKQLDILYKNFYERDNYQHCYIGEAQNNSGESMNWASAYLGIYDANGKLIRTWGRSFLDPLSLADGEKGVFDICIGHNEPVTTDYLIILGD